MHPNNSIKSAKLGSRVLAKIYEDDVFVLNERNKKTGGELISRKNDVVHQSKSVFV